jgi:hypothetical protein
MSPCVISGISKFEKNTMRRCIAAALAIFFSAHIAHSQVLISILLGDKLNSDKLEFGLVGGLNFRTMTDLDNAELARGLYLGMYFDIKLNEKWAIHPEIWIKHNFGAGGLPGYEVGDPELDAMVDEATVERRLNYFNLPVTMRYRAWDRFTFGLGPYVGLRYKAKDNFVYDVFDDEDLTLTYDIKDQTTTFDAGGIIGIAYFLSEKKKKPMSLGIFYTEGFVDVLKDLPGNQRNRSFAIALTVPIGAGKQNKS